MRGIDLPTHPHRAPSPAHRFLELLNPSAIEATVVRKLAAGQDGVQPVRSLPDWNRSPWSLHFHAEFSARLPVARESYLRIPSSERMRTLGDLVHELIPESGVLTFARAGVLPDILGVLQGGIPDALHARIAARCRKAAAVAIARDGHASQLRDTLRDADYESEAIRAAARTFLLSRLRAASSVESTPESAAFRVGTTVLNPDWIRLGRTVLEDAEVRAEAERYLMARVRDGYSAAFVRDEAEILGLRSFVVTPRFLEQVESSIHASLDAELASRSEERDDARFDGKRLGIREAVNLATLLPVHDPRTGDVPAGTARILREASGKAEAAILAVLRSEELGTASYFSPLESVRPAVELFATPAFRNSARFAAAIVHAASRLRDDVVQLPIDVRELLVIAPASALPLLEAALPRNAARILETRVRNLRPGFGRHSAEVETGASSERDFVTAELIAIARAVAAVTGNVTDSARASSGCGLRGTVLGAHAAQFSAILLNQKRLHRDREAFLGEVVEHIESGRILTPAAHRALVRLGAELEDAGAEFGGPLVSGLAAKLGNVLAAAEREGAESGRGPLLELAAALSTDELARALPGVSRLVLLRESARIAAGAERVPAPAAPPLTPDQIAEHALERRFGELRGGFFFHHRWGDSELAGVTLRELMMLVRIEFRGRDDFRDHVVRLQAVHFRTIGDSAASVEAELFLLDRTARRGLAVLDRPRLAAYREKLADVGTMCLRLAIESDSSQRVGRFDQALQLLERSIAAEHRLHSDSLLDVESGGSDIAASSEYSWLPFTTRARIALCLGALDLPERAGAMLDDVLKHLAREASLPSPLVGRREGSFEIRRAELIVNGVDAAIEEFGDAGYFESARKLLGTLALLQRRIAEEYRAVNDALCAGTRGNTSAPPESRELVRYVRITRIAAKEAMLRYESGDTSGAVEGLASAREELSRFGARSVDPAFTRWIDSMYSRLHRRLYGTLPE